MAIRGGTSLSLSFIFSFDNLIKKFDLVWNRTHNLVLARQALYPLHHDCLHVAAAHRSFQYIYLYTIVSCKWLFGNQKYSHIQNIHNPISIRTNFCNNIAFHHLIFFVKYFIFNNMNMQYILLHPSGLGGVVVIVLAYQSKGRGFKPCRCCVIFCIKNQDGTGEMLPLWLPKIKWWCHTSNAKSISLQSNFSAENYWTNMAEKHLPTYKRSI